MSETTTTEREEVLDGSAPEPEVPQKGWSPRRILEFFSKTKPEVTPHTLPEGEKSVDPSGPPSKLEIATDRYNQYVAFQEDVENKLSSLPPEVLEGYKKAVAPYRKSYDLTTNDGRADMGMAYTREQDIFKERYKPMLDKPEQFTQVHNARNAEVAAKKARKEEGERELKEIAVQRKLRNAS